jgi:hypothetical protein
MAKLFIIARKPGAFLVHVDEDLAQRAVLVLAGAQVDLVTADDGLLGVALAPFGQLLAVGLDDLLDDDLLDDLLGQTCAFSMVEPVSSVSAASSSSSTRAAASGWLSFDPSR